MLPIVRPLSSVNIWKFWVMLFKSQNWTTPKTVQPLFQKLSNEKYCLKDYHKCKLKNNFSSEIFVTGIHLLAYGIWMEETKSQWKRSGSVWLFMSSTTRQKTLDLEKDHELPEIPILICHYNTTSFIQWSPVILLNNIFTLAVLSVSIIHRVLSSFFFVRK